MYWMDMTEQEIADTVGAFGVPKFRAAQVRDWLKKGVRPEDMTNLPKNLREQLSSVPFGGARIFDKRMSEKDGTVKYLFELEDGNLVEGVLMRYSYGNTVCLSTQVGCNMGCKFCASTLEGCVRSLRPGEMLSFLAEIERDEPPTDRERTVTNIVLMGSGEPLDNYDNVVTFLKRVTSPSGPNISARNISLSTCGLVPKIYSFIDDAPHVTLSISLHAHSNEVRSSIMPVNKAYPIEQVLEAANTYAQHGTARRIRIRADRRGQRFRSGRKGARATAEGHAVPCESHSAEPSQGARAQRRNAAARVSVPGLVGRKPHLGDGAAGNGRRHRRRLRTASKEGSQ